VKFLVDAQLPRHLAAILNWHGQDALHTLDLPEGNRTPDWRINQISVEENRVVVTKDADFVNSFLLSAVPYKLLLVSTGNISNRDIQNTFANNLPAILMALEESDYVEISQATLICHTTAR
jgi:predicted nuclease of predicted toxin-antitoxin system